MQTMAPSAAALYWFLRANGETTYRNQQELAAAVGIDYATLKNGLRLLRERELVQREGKTIRVKP